MNKKFKNIRNFEALIEARLSSGNLEEPISKKAKKSKHLSDLDLVVGIYRLLVFDFDRYSTKWSLAALVQLVTGSKNPLIKWFSLKISSLLLGLSPGDEAALFSSHFSPGDLQQSALKVEQILLNDPELQLNPNEDVIATNFTKSDYDYFRTNQDHDTNFVRFDNGPKLRRRHQAAPTHTNLIFVPSTVRNLNKIVMSVVTDQCVVIEGALSTGKTCLIEYLSEQSGNKLVKYQMDEFMDSKSLIGNYVCAEIPGEFVWKPGPLFSCAQHGSWLLLEDFDHAPVDSLSLLIDLLETECIKTSDNKIALHEHFRLFLTLRPSDTRPTNTNFIDSIRKLSRSVLLEPLADQEIVGIVCEKYPSFKIATSAHLAQKLLDIYQELDFGRAIDVDGEQMSARESRCLSLRDLLKVCNRMKTERRSEPREMLVGLLNDVYECFLCFVSNRRVRCELAVRVGAKLNVSREEVHALLFNKKPDFAKKECHVTCGRVRLGVDTNGAPVNPAKFVYTRSALNLLEKIARCIECNEPVLLCGETGVGKTSALQHLAGLLGKRISVINLNQQTETSDLLGSFKPVDIKTQMKIIKEKFVALFSKCFDVDENSTFLNHVQTCYSKSNWKYLLRLISHATESASKKLCHPQRSHETHNQQQWKELKHQCQKLEDNLAQLANKFTFQFFDGKLSEAIVSGEWIILDEINMASAETLQFLGSLLDNTDSASSSIILYERGDHEPLKRHADFRLFGAMNPASDVGKRNLPANIRNRFTEIFVDELDDPNDLALLTKSYLQFVADSNAALINSIVAFYQRVRDAQFLKKLSNGCGMPPTYSLRTLCRALKNASLNSCNNSLISIFDSLCLSFLTDLNRESSVFLEDYIRSTILKSHKVQSKIQRNKPQLELYAAQRLAHVNIEGYWMLRGQMDCFNDPGFIFTKSASDNLRRLCRVCSARLPCLIQGDTSIGKTSLIKWLAAATGNRLIRINNHDHTDLAEYIGSYVMDGESRLVFKEGLLVEAMRHGYWILLDELNLASSEVLEALNRVLDDNRELYIPESQQLIKAHPRFLLFATQNPPGKYAGRKQLSKAFRNRFIELHYDELPEDELLLIVEKKCQLPKSYATLLIKSISDLKTKRSQVSSIFLGKDSLITLRDLFRWARRYSKADLDHNTDWKQYLAEQGFLLLSSRCRAEQDVRTIHASIQTTFGRKIDINELNEPKNLCASIMRVLEQIVAYSRVHFEHFVWTPSAKRTALLAALAYKFNEPFLLVGETGVGKTTICQILSHMSGKKLSTVNCHMHSEASDFLGSMRPVRQPHESGEPGKLFEWKDGPLVSALKQGHDFLIDEISLADDSVLERLNSVLEEEKTLLLAENITESQSIRGDENFRLSATMNPSGDFGKKELSAALRNRFTEIWCPAPNVDCDDFSIILEHSLKMADSDTKARCIRVTVDFMRWLAHQTFFKSIVSIRDLSHWVTFMNRMSHVQPFKLLMHAASLVFIDSFSSDLDHSQPRQQCIDCLVDLMRQHGLQAEHTLSASRIVDSVDKFECGDFTIVKGDNENGEEAVAAYVLDSHTTVNNLLRVMRCMVMDSPIMLEGSPGVGKTSLVQALGRLTNNKVVRINLSEQTDLNELFGADLPVGTDQSNSFQQRFQWFDGPLLLALKKGYWVILDEINLASQSVLEGLNSCLDHRGEVFIAELNRTFTLDKHRTKIFACQNPFSQGGGRKGLPKSFLNRFAKVYVDKMSHDDLLHICQSMYAIERGQLSKMIQFNSVINQEVCVEKKWGSVGSPWEFNLRDLFRWCDLLVECDGASPADFVYLIYASRFRDVADKKMVYTKFESLFGVEPYQQQNKVVRITTSHVQIGQSFFATDHYGHIDQNFVLTNTNLKYLESIVKCVQMNWMVVLVGRGSTGKTSLVRLVASLLGKSLVEFSVNNSTDTSDLLGGYEKIKHLRQSLVDLRSKIVTEYRQRVVHDLHLLAEYFEFVFRSQKLHRLNDEDLDEVKELCQVFRESMERLDMRADLALLPKLSHYEKMKFEWVDSALVKAIENGDWVLIDNANFCAPSVLDRLNPLLEPNGRLQINEKGIQQDNKLVEVRPNKNFRLFLSMNEQFGELSRPMRNRGCEIYLNELDTQQDIEDVYIILKSLFPMQNYFYPHTKFGHLFKIYKLAYDYWLIDSKDPHSCFAQSVLECGLQNELAPMTTMPAFYTNLNNIKNSKVYTFLFNYSLMDTFRQAVNGQMLESRDLHLSTVHKYHQRVLETCNYVVVLVRNVPVGALAQVVAFLRVNVASESLVQFFDRVLNGEYMNAFVAHLREAGREAGMQLDAETVDLTQNVHLCQKLASLTKFKQCEQLSRIFGVHVNLELFKYRINSLYTIQSDSFYFLIENNSEMSQHKYLLLVKEFVSVFCDCVLRSQFDEARQHDTIQLCTLLMEKFYLILSSRFDQLLTISYLKYYWNLIRANVQNLNQIDNMWSTQFNSMYSLFDQNLTYDDSLYKIFYSLWSKQNKQHISLYNDKSQMTNMETISNFMANNSLNSIMSCRNFTKSISTLLSFFSNGPVQTPALSRDQIEILVKHISEYKPKSLGPDLRHELNIVLNKSYPLMLHHYSDIIHTLLNTSHRHQQTSLAYASLSELIVGDFIFDLSSKCTSKNLNLFKSIEHLLSIEHLDSELIGGYQVQSLEPLNILAYDFLNSLMAKILLNSEQRLDLTLNFYDLKISLIHTLTDYIWSNYKLLSNKQAKVDQINKKLLDEVRNELSFVSGSEIEHYLYERGFDRRFLNKSDSPCINLLVYGLFYLILYCPMEPLDPVEHDVLVQKNQLTISHTQQHQVYLCRKNVACRLKICLESEPVDSQDHLTDRLNKPVYYLIKSEIENFLRQFLAYDQVSALWSNNQPSEQFSTWLNSIENLINKLKAYYNYSDVVGYPVRGLSLVWHAMSSMYTECRAQKNVLALELMQYPVMDSYMEIAERMSAVKSNDMHLVALMNVVNSVLVESAAVDRVTRLVVKVCDHFNSEYFEYKRQRDEEQQVDAYKYKQYGQEKIEQELEDQEFESKFPSYEHNFSEFIQINVLEDEKKETKTQKDSFVYLFDQVYDLISRVYEPCTNKKFILDTFLKSYTIGTGLIRDTIVQNSDKNTLLSHILFSTSVNLKEERKLFDIYHDSNCEQVLVLKKCLDSLTKRIESVLKEWPQNPVLVELIKIVNKIESFNLNDPLMKYLTGIELLLGRADSWQLIASRDVSLESELKALNQLVVEWRKLELKQWMNSCESEMDKIKKENAFVWFFNIYSTCTEYLRGADESEDKLVSILFQFMASAPIGQFSVRLKSIHLCHSIFCKFECKKSKSLNKILWSVWNFYESLYSAGVRAQIAKTQADIDKELRDFVTIYKWQDATYWSIKNSVAKSNRHFVRTIKKFKIFLKSEIDWSKIANGLKIEVDRVWHTQFVNQPNCDYALKMQKFCRTILTKKFKNNKFSKHCAQFVHSVRHRFQGLAQETRQLNNQFVCDKKNAPKYKKEFKYLNQEKLKFMSDLIKRLSLMGLSYRKGQILAHRYAHLEQVILGHKTDLISHFEFYLSTRLFFDYKSNRPSQQAANLPLDKFNGYVNHLFSFVHTQRLNLTKLSVHMAQLTGLNDKLATIVKSNDSSPPRPNTQSHYLKLNCAYAKIKKLLIQMKYFYENLFNLGQSEIVLSITNEFDQVKCALESVLCLIPGEKSADELEYANGLSDYVIDRGPLMHLGSLIQKHCEPFYEYYTECITLLDCGDLDAQAAVVAEPVAEHSLEHCVQRTKTKVLKIVENFYKKYSQHVIKELESDHFFTLECMHNFTSDCESLQLDTLVKQIAKILSLSLTNRTGLVEHVTSLKSVLDVFWRYVSAYEQHLCQAHVKCCQMLETLVKVFDEYKQGLSVPKELEQDDNESAENETDEKKFSTDDAAGLGDGQGSKDVSDQIENEDQLDDAKTKEQREEDGQDEEAEQIDEEEKGIEMSEDFEAKMDDVNMDEEAEKEDNAEDEEDLDDQKGDVDNAMDYLDEQLWDKEDNEAEQEGQDEENELDEDIHGGDKEEDTSELMAKEQDLPMIDNDENRTQDNEENVPEQQQDAEHNDEQQSENENNEQDIELMREDGSEDQMKEINEEEKETENEQANDEQTQEEKGEEEKMPEENQIEEEMQNGEQEQEQEQEQEREGEETNLNENSRNYGCNELSEKSENDANKMNWSGEAEDNDQMNDELNEADVNQEAQNEKSQGQGQSELSVNSAKWDQAESKQSKMREKNQNRVLDDQEHKLDAIKDLNIVDVDQEEMGDDGDETSEQKGVEFKHLNDQEEKSDQRVYDAATEEQKKPQRAERQLDDEQTKLDQEDGQVDQQRKENNKLRAKQLEESKQSREADVHEENLQSNDQSMKEADFVSTMNAQRPSESLFATLKDNLVVDISRETVERDLAKFKEVNRQMVDSESLKLWLEYEAITQQLSRELCEQLRLILEPTICSKLKGDYKTGKRLNMKRVVEYIATEYRKDKIWLRRTKPNKRDYQVVLAVDNSSSMSDNHCMQLAYETIATLTNAFSLLEVGQFGLVSFGEKVQPLHPLDEHFNSDVGARILSNINFNHDRTKIAEMLDTSIGLFTDTSSNTAVSKLLIILSDGRGVFYEGIEKVKNSVQRALVEGIFIVFVILDITGTSTSSIYDIKMPVYSPGNPIPAIKSYMENFPFPFYICLREVNSLPMVMIEALKQWFDMVSRDAHS